MSADSVWAHWASGVRGSLLRHIERLEAGNPTDETNLQSLIRAGFEILEQAAGEKMFVGKI
ncbi:MAG: hypothetical protein GXP38_10570 [Chloroflexi bacterium]|nr:hypothetical protein [Chloroflexota bacterium]